MTRLTKMLAACAVATVMVLGGASVAQAGGPVILAGIDAEDGGPGGHGSISTYETLVTNHYNNATNAGTGILVVGGGKSPFDSATRFWNAISAGTGLGVTYVNDASNITNQMFTGFRMIAVVSDVGNTPSGGLTQAENDALTARSGDVAAFVNNGGALLGFTSDFATNQYGYMGTVGAITTQIGLGYTDITTTPDGQAAGLDDTSLDVCCWHDKYLTYPSFLAPLAYEAGTTTNPAAVGGRAVTIAPAGDKFMTGGGGLAEDRLRHGSVLHCTVSDPGPDRLQVNWGKGNKFHLEDLTDAACTDDPGISEGKPVAGFDTHTGAGSGRYNGVSGATAEWTITDAGEPGRSDTLKIKITDANGDVVLDREGTLDTGNNQAHNG